MNEEILDLVEDSDVSIVPSEVTVPEGASAIEVDGKIIGYVQDKDYSAEEAEG